MEVCLGIKHPVVLTEKFIKPYILCFKLRMTTANKIHGLKCHSPHNTTHYLCYCVRLCKNIPTTAVCASSRLHP
jgi:hypothetical protein